MQYYPEVPLWWYGIIGIISLSFLCITIKIIPTRLPIWAAVVAILLSFILSIPLSILMAISNQQIATQVVFELIAGYMLPGKPIASMIFKAVGYMTNFQATKFAADLKLGHYMKVPPRIMFTIQIVPTIITCIWVTLIQDWMLNNIEDVCTPQQKQHFICPGSTIFATASVIFGAVGPQRLFNLGAPYATCLTHLAFIQLTICLQILCSPLVLPHWIPCTHPFLLPRSPLPFLHLAIHQHSRCIRCTRIYTSVFGDQLQFLDNSWIYLQLCHPSLPL